MLHFCTLFDSNYLSRGLVTYESLEKVCPSFHLYIFAFDDLALNVLTKLALKHATIVSLAEFEDEKLLEVKPTRSAGEYCWTATPSIISYSLKTFEINHCTYIDADLFFYSDPSILLEEMSSKSVMITSHRYTPKYDKTALSGKYCVQFMTFKNDEAGNEVLNWWREACLDWCYARFEDGKFGDQKYLDDWLTRFDCVHELAHLGGGVAPWNVQQYEIEKRDGKLQGREIALAAQFDFVFFHFHQLKLLPNNRVDLCRYELSPNVKNLIYLPYISALHKKINLLTKMFPELSNKGITYRRFTWKTPLVYIKRKLRNEYNIFAPNEGN